MKSTSDFQPSEKSSSKKSAISEEQKSMHLSTRMSTKASGFSLFGCCWKGGDAPSTVALSKGKLGRPATFMGAQTTMTVGKMSSKMNNREGSYLGSEPSVIEQESFSSRRYAVDQVFILGGSYKIVAKITIVKVAKATSIIDQGRLELKALNGSVKDPPTRNSSHAEHDVKPRSQSGLFTEKEMPKKMKKEIFSKFEKGIKAEEWQEITPEKVAMHIANRLKCDTIVDALCGFGGSTIQFAKTCNFVIGIDIKNTKTLWAKHNAKIYGVEHKIDFITGDFMKIRNITADIVFLGPTIEPSQSGKPFSLFENIKPDPLSLLSKSLQVSYKIALQLPGDTQIEELPQLFHQSLEKYDSYSKRFCIEIEKVMNSHNETECIIVYFGDCSSINRKEEYEAIYEYISTHESPQWKREFPFPAIAAIIDKIGIRRTFKYLSEVENQLSIHEPSLFGAFLHKLTQEAILSQTNLNRIIEEESRKTEWTGINPNSYNSASMKTYTNVDLVPESLSRHQSKIASLNESQDKPKGLLSRLVTDPKMLRGPSQMVDPYSKSPALPKDERYSQYSPPSVLDNINGTLKNSYDMSELAVSSYSVSSDYLKDSSEDGDMSRQMLIENGDALTDPSPHNSSLAVGEKPYFRYSTGEGLRKKERASSQYFTEIKPLDGEIKGKKEKKWKEGSDKKENNRSFLLQCGDEF